MLSGARRVLRFLQGRLTAGAVHKPALGEERRAGSALN